MELKFRNKAAFAFGAFGKDIVYMLVNSYLLYYYNVVLGVSATFIGTVMMAARVFDALNDPFMGVLVAKTKTRWGRFRPWIFCGTVINALTVYALFAVPGGFGDGSTKAWLAVIYILWGVTYTMMDIPFWSMIPAITFPGKDREQLSSIARSAAGVGDALPTVLTMVIVPLLSGGAIIANYTIGFKWWALIVAVVFVVSEVVFCLNVPEKRVEEMESVGVGQMFKSLFKNDQAMVVVAAIILVYMAINLVGNLILYFFQFDVGNTDAYSLFAAVCFGAQVVAMFLIPLFRKKVEKLRLFKLGILVQIIGFAILLGFAYTHIYKANWLILCLPGILVYVGYGVLNVMMTIFLSDSVDYGEAKNGSREESVIFSMQTFTVKLASGIAVFVAGLGIDLIGLIAEAETQSAQTLAGLRLIMTIPSVILLVLAFLVFQKGYKLNDKKMAEISAQLGRDGSEAAGEEGAARA